MNIVVVGLSHKTAPVEIREKVSIPETQIEDAISQLRSYPHVDEVVVISTCNRLEIYAVISETEQGVREISQFLADKGQVDLFSLRRYLFVLLHGDAMRHLLRVSAGLESLVLGEGQILAQVKAAHKLGQKYKGMGRLLDRLFKQALTAGKRVRSETNIGTGAVSISSAAVELALLKSADLGANRILIVGAGKMSRLLVQHLLAKRVSNIAIANRSQKRAQDLANQFPENEIQILPLEQLNQFIGKYDVVFTSTAAQEPFLTKTRLEQTLPAEQNLMIFDISVPRNVSTDVESMNNIEAYNVDDLKEVVAQNQESRRKLALEAEGVLEEEISAYTLWLRSLDTVPTISSLRSKVESIREQELEKALSRLGVEFGEKHQEIIEALTRGIVNKILHEPMVQLRAQQDIEARKKALQSLQMLFDLDIETAV